MKLKEIFGWGFVAILTVTLFALMAATASADSLTIATGKAGGGYAKADTILAERLKQRGVETTIVNLNGSDEITLAVCARRADVGRTQVDAIFARAIEGCQLAVAASHGEEFAIMMVPPKSKIRNLSDLDESSKVLVDTVGSGSELFWRTIVGIETGDDGNKSDWAKAKPVMDTVSEANTLAQFGDAHAVIMVRKADSLDISNLLALGWSFADMYDKDINDQLFNDQPLYQPTTVKFGKTKVDSYIVNSFVVVRASDEATKTLVRSVK